MLGYHNVEQAPAFTPDEFKRLYAIAMAGAEGMISVQSPQRFEIIDDVDMTVQTFQFTDHPLNRAFSAVAESGLLAHQNQFFSFMVRFIALSNTYLPEPWMIERGQIVQIHDALLGAVADLPLTPEYFEKRQFRFRKQALLKILKEKQTRRNRPE